MSNAPKKQNFLQGATLLAAATLIVKVIGAVYKIPLQAVLGKLGYSYFSSAYDIYTLLLLISTAGLPVAMSRMISAASSLNNHARTRKVYNTSRTIFLIIGAVSTALMMFFCQALANSQEQPDAALAIFCLAPSAFFMSVISTYRGFFQGQGNMLPTSKSQVLEAVFKLGAGLAGAVVILQLGGQLLTAVQITLNNLDRDAVFLQILGKIVADLAAAADHDPANPAGNNAEVFQKGGQVFGGSGNEDAVAFPEDEITVGSDGLALAQNGADQDTAFDDVVHIHQRHVAQLAGSVHTKFHDFRLALGEAVPLQEAGVLQQTFDFYGSLLFGIDGHGQTEFIAHGINLASIIRVADTGNGVQIFVHAVGGDAAQQIYFVHAGGGDEQVCFHNTCFLQNFHGSAIALDTHDVILLQIVVEHSGSGVDEGNVVTFGGEQPGQCGANHAGTCDDNVHRIPPVQETIFYTL